MRDLLRQSYESKIRPVSEIQGTDEEEQASPEQDVEVFPKQDVERLVETHRRMYLEIRDAVSDLCSVFHPTLLLRFVYGVVFITVNLYLAVDSVFDGRLLKALIEVGMAGMSVLLFLLVARASAGIAARASFDHSQIARQNSVNLASNITPRDTFQ